MSGKPSLSLCTYVTRAKLHKLVYITSGALLLDLLNTQAGLHFCTLKLPTPHSLLIMANFVAKQVSKRILKESTANNFGTQVSTFYHRTILLFLTTAQDAYYEQVPATDLNGNPTGKTVKRPRAVPEGISKHDAKILNKVKRRAHRLDSSINFCGIRLGWSAIIGIIPG